MTKTRKVRADSRLEAVLFDVGGVLVELGGLEVFRTWAGVGLSDDEIWRRWLASPAVRSFERGEIAAEAFACDVVAEMGLAVAHDHFLEAFIAWPRRLLPGVEALLSRLQPELHRATLSNTNGLHWPRVMEEMGLAAHFEHHFPSHRTGRIKPDAEAFLHAVQALGCRPDAVLFLDDARPNVEAARAAGLKAEQTVGVAAAAQALEAYGLLDT